MPAGAAAQGKRSSTAAPLAGDGGEGKTATQKNQGAVLKGLAVAIRYVNVIYIHTVGRSRSKGWPIAASAAVIQFREG